MNSTNSIIQFVDATKKYHFTVQDLKNMSVGQTIHLICFDRNICDYSNEFKLPTDINEVLKNFMYIDLTKTDLTACGGHVKLFNKNEVFLNQPMSFDIDTEYHFWSPIDKESQTVNLKDFGEGLYFKKFVKKYSTNDDYEKEVEQLNNKKWFDYDNSTRIGWRGPCMETKYISEVGVDKLYSD